MTATALERDNSFQSDGNRTKFYSCVELGVRKTMSKVSLFFVLLAVSITVQGAPLSPFDDFVEAAEAGQWEKLQTLLVKNFGKDGWKDLSLGGVKDLKPPKGGHVYGESEYTFHSQSDFNGQKSEKSGGHKVINEDGKVEEFDFKPTSQQEDFFKKFGFKPVEQS